jgi:hypothetical protein
MRWVLALGVGVLVIVVVVGVLASGRSGGDRGELLNRVGSELQEIGFPKPLTSCMAHQLEASLDSKEIERLYDSPRGQREGTAAVVANPMVQKAVVASLKSCALSLENSGRISGEELIEALRGLGELSYRQDSRRRNEACGAFVESAIPAPSPHAKAPSGTSHRWRSSLTAAIRS